MEIFYFLDGAPLVVVSGVSLVTLILFVPSLRGLVLVSLSTGRRVLFVWSLVISFPR